MRGEGGEEVDVWVGREVELTVAAVVVAAGEIGTLWFAFVFNLPAKPPPAMPFPENDDDDDDDAVAPAFASKLTPPNIPPAAGLAAAFEEEEDEGLRGGCLLGPAAATDMEELFLTFTTRRFDITEVDARENVEDEDGGVIEEDNSDDS